MNNYTHVELVERQFRLMIFLAQDGLRKAHDPVFVTQTLKNLEEAVEQTFAVVGAWQDPHAGKD